MDKDLSENYKKNCLVKEGGLKALLACYLKHNKGAYKKFKKECTEEESDEEPAKKRQRANSNASAKSNKSDTSVSKDKKKKIKKVDKSQIMTRRKSSGEWQPNPDHQVSMAGVKDFKFERINADKYTGLTGAAKDNSYEAKALFGTTGDTYGDWSNQQLKDKVGKGFTKAKNKMKNKNFHASGGGYNMHSVNSVLM